MVDPQGRIVLARTLSSQNLPALEADPPGDAKARLGFGPLRFGAILAFAGVLAAARQTQRRQDRHDGADSIAKT